MKKVFISCMILIVFLFLLNNCNNEWITGGQSQDDYSQIAPAYYEITLTLDNTQVNPHQALGVEYGNIILQRVPKYGFILDSYLLDFEEVLYPDESYQEKFFQRIDALRKSIPAEYYDEIEGLASVVCTTEINEIGDGKLSRDELYLINLLPDINRDAQCSVVSVFGSLTENSKTLIGRNLDWFAGAYNQINRLHAIVTINNGEKSICLIGYLGFVGVITAVNNDQIFSCILDSGTNLAYPSVENKSSYPFALRYALENYSNKQDIAQYMADTTRNYTFGHLIYVADPVNAIIVENDLSVPAHRRIRNVSSKLRDGTETLPAEFQGKALCTVNSFVLDGNLNNHNLDPDDYDYQRNFKRRQRIVDELGWLSLPSRPGATVNTDDIKTIMTRYFGEPGYMDSGNLYNNITQQVMVFQPETGILDIHFNLDEYGVAEHPSFHRIEISFD